MTPQKFFSIKFLLLLEFAAYKKNLLFHSVTVQIYQYYQKQREKRKKKKKNRSKRRVLVSAVEN